MIFLKSKVTDLIKKNIFLPQPCATEGNWIATDNKERYTEHLKTMPNDWYYRSNTVHYQVNSNQYRTHEFNQIDWVNSVVLLGCSQVYGVGVTDNHTISSVLSDMIQKPVINLGVPGASNNLIMNNNIILHSICPEPLAVINLYSGVDRTTYYHKREIKNHGSWTSSDPFMAAWSEDYSNCEVQTLMASKLINQLWSNTKLIEATNFTNTYKLLHCYYLLTQRNDYARDNMHFGRHTTTKIAEQLAEQLT